MYPKLSVVALWAPDIAIIAHFYRDVIGLTPIPHHGERPHFDLGGTFLVILKGRPSPPEESNPPRFPLLAFSVNDLEAAIAHLRQHGVQLPWGIESDERSRWVMFHDPAGNLIELVQFKE